MVVGQSDSELLSASARGDADAFTTFFRRYERDITTYAIRRCPTPEDVADSVADTFLTALSASGRYRAETATALPWLYGIARRVIMRQRRTGRRHRRPPVGSGTVPRYVGLEEDLINQAIDAARLAPQLELAMRQLSSREREVLELVAYHGLTPFEVAVSLGVSPNTARLRLLRARNRMRRLLQGTQDAMAAEVAALKLGVRNADG
jgi:RNA polymerase sigma factor (sigma-70 family)